MASFDSLIKDILPYVPGCPDSLIETNLRSATIELCEKSRQTRQECRAIEAQSIAMLINLQPNWFVGQSHLNVPVEQDRATELRKLIDTLPSDILGT